MYWIYLILFVIIVFVPDIVVGDVYFIGEEKMEELMIFVLGSVVMLLFIFKDKQFRFNLKEKTEIQKDFHETSQSLNSSYSYIGEANRKLEILRSISLQLTDLSNVSEDEKQKIFLAIRDAVKVLSKTDEFTINFINFNKRKIVYSVPGYQLNDKCDIIGENINAVFESDKSIVKVKDCVIVKSINDVGGIFAVVMFRCKEEDLSENVELIQTLATQSLSLYTSCENNTEKQGSEGENLTKEEK